MPRELTVREVAERERVTRQTVYNWMDKGLVKTKRTPGGGIRIIVQTEHDKSDDSKR